jgi:methyltransferase (TIGR00027 family)
MSDSQIKNVSDTALLVAGLRALESDRPDAFFHDAFARRLAGDRGMAICEAVPHREMSGFGIAIRTRFIDELLLKALRNAEIRTVVALGAGLDTKPWRLNLPPDLRWIEVDFPEMLQFKHGVMSSETPRCRLERLPADITKPSDRHAIYSAVGNDRTLLLTEGLLMYLPAAAVRSLASEAAEKPSIVRWIFDLTTTAFSTALGGQGNRSVQHVQAADHLSGEQILQTLHDSGWPTLEWRSYITDLDFAKDRIAAMMRAAPQPVKTPNFPPNDPTGVHLLGRS